MTRDLARLASGPFDAVVIGGGVYGLAVAWELSSRDLRVALVDRGDFAAATSFNSLKTVHGGIRALQHAAIGDMREFVRERRALATIAPRLVRTVPFVVPTSRHPIRNRTAMRLFLALYDRLSSDRNAGVAPALALPPSRTVSRSECLRRNPFIDPRGVTGGAVWHDYQLHSPERFAIALLRSSVDRGAAAANYVEAVSLLPAPGRVTGVRARDVLTGSEFDIRASLVVNAAGPWAWPFLDRALGHTSARRPALSLAMNLVVNRPPGEAATGGIIDNRFLFMVPWRDCSIVGTSHRAFVDSPDRLSIDDSDVDALLEEAATAFPGASLRREDVRLAHRGLLPAARHGDSALLKRSIVHDHRKDSIEGLVSVVGVRYTTARATAEATGNLVLSSLGKPPRPSQTATTLLADVPLPAGNELVHAVRDEMAVHLTDALLRRTGVAAGGYPGDDVVRDAAAIMATECGWTQDRTEREIAAVRDAFKVLPHPSHLLAPAPLSTPEHP